jgi:hypothetical protein
MGRRLAAVGVFRAAALFSAAAATLSGCLGSISDYSFPDLAPIKGPIKVVGSFDTDAGGCGSYSAAAIDEKIIRPAIQAELKRRGAVAAADVSVHEKWYDVPLTLLLVPAILGCSNWTITGQAVAADRP